MDFDVLKKEKTAIEVPWQNIPLPSQGKLYPEGHPLHNEETVEIKEMTAKEINILHSPALLENGTASTQLIKSCLINALLEPETLLLSDKSAILLALRISAFSAEYRVKIKCDECNQDFTNTFDLSKVEIKNLGGEPLKPFQNLFTTKLPKSGKQVWFSLLTDSDDLDIMRANKRRKKIITSQIDTSLTDRLVRQIKKIENEEDPAKIVKAIETMHAADVLFLRRKIREIEPEVIMRQEAQCSNCGYEDEVNIPLGIEFFWPSELPGD